jgi:hypothetical protein
LKRTHISTHLRPPTTLQLRSHLIENLPEATQATLYIIFDFLHFVACYQSENGMTLPVLASIFGPFLISLPSSGANDAMAMVRDAPAISSVMQTLIRDKELVFKKICHSPRLTNDYLRVLKPRPENIPELPEQRTSATAPAPYVHAMSVAIDLKDQWETVTTDDGQVV